MSDLELIDCFERISEATPVPMASVNLTFQSSGAAVTFQLEELFNDEGPRKYLSRRSYLLRTIAATFENSAVLTISRLFNGQNMILDEDTLAFSGANSPGEQFFQLVGVVSEILPIITPTAVSVGMKLEGFDNLYRAREEAILRLETSQTNLTADLTKNAIRIEDESKRRTEKLEQDYKKKQSKLAARYKEKHDALAVREKEIDDRDNRHKRRLIEGEFNKKLQESAKTLTLTPETKKAMMWPNITTGGIFFVFVVAAVFYGVADWRSDGSASWYLIARQLAFSAAAAVTGTFWIRMQQRWFQRHADTDFRLKKLDLDLNRAIWLVELAQEWNLEKGQAMPEALLDRLSRSLFVEEGTSDGDIHPLETLLSAMMGSKGKVKIELAGTKFSAQKDGTVTQES